MGVLCSIPCTESDSELLDIRGKRKPIRKELLSEGLLSGKHKITSAPNEVERKSEELESFHSLEELKTTIRKQQLEIERLTKSLQESVEKNQLNETELRKMKNQRLLSLALPTPQMLLVHKRDSEKEMVCGEQVTIASNSGYSSESPRRNIVDSNSTPATPGSSVDLEDLEVIQVAKKQLRDSQRRSLIMKSRLREAESRTQFANQLDGGEKDPEQSPTKPAHNRSNSCPDVIANRLNVIESQIYKTDGELTLMRRRSVDILIGRHAAIDSFGKIEKTINKLAAKKRDLETERFEALMQLQDQLMSPGTVDKIGDNERQQMVDTNPFRCNDTTYPDLKSNLLDAVREEKHFEEARAISLSKSVSCEGDTSLNSIVLKDNEPNEIHVHQNIPTWPDLL